MPPNTPTDRDRAWWSTPLRGDGASGAASQASAEARRRARRAAPPRPAPRPVPEHLRADADDAATRYVRACAPWSPGWRLVHSTARGTPHRHRVTLYVQLPASGEVRFAEAEGVDAFDAFAAFAEHLRAGGAAPRAAPAPAATPASDLGADLAALGLDAVPDPEGLRRAWRAAARKHHPDAGGDPARFAAARRAYEHLARRAGA